MKPGRDGLATFLLERVCGKKRVAYVRLMEAIRRSWMGAAFSLEREYQGLTAFLPDAQEAAFAGPRHVEKKAIAVK
jgi:hypothetical protein